MISAEDSSLPIPFGKVPAGTEVLDLPAFTLAILVYPDGTIKALSPTDGVVQIKRPSGSNLVADLRQSATYTGEAS